MIIFPLQVEGLWVFIWRRGCAEKGEKAKQSGALSPQSGDEALETDVLNVFQTLAPERNRKKLHIYLCVSKSTIF